MFYMPGTKMLFGDAKDTCEGAFLLVRSAFHYSTHDSSLLRFLFDSLETDSGVEGGALNLYVYDGGREDRESSGVFWSLESACKSGGSRRTLACSRGGMLMLCMKRCISPNLDFVCTHMCRLLAMHSLLYLFFMRRSTSRSARSVGVWPGGQPNTSRWLREASSIPSYDRAVRIKGSSSTIVTYQPIFDFEGGPSGWQQQVSLSTVLHRPKHYPCHHYQPT